MRGSSSRREEAAWHRGSLRKHAGMPLTLELCTFDPGISASSPAAYAAAVAEVVETAWDEGADIVLLPEFTWLGIEPLWSRTRRDAWRRCFGVS